MSTNEELLGRLNDLEIAIRTGRGIKAMEASMTLGDVMTALMAPPAPAAATGEKQEGLGNDMTAPVPTGEFIAGFPRFGTLAEAAQVLAERIAKHYPCDDDCWKGRVGADADLILEFLRKHRTQGLSSRNPESASAARAATDGADTRRLADLLQQMLDVAENADETGYVADHGFVNLDKLHAEVRKALTQPAAVTDADTKRLDWLDVHHQLVIHPDSLLGGVRVNAGPFAKSFRGDRLRWAIDAAMADAAQRPAAATAPLPGEEGGKL